MILTSPAAAESAFYAAFSGGDHKRMMAVWATAEDLVCVHPMWPRLNSRDAISASWQQILAGEPQRIFDIRLKASWGDTNIAVRVVDEIISVPTSGLRFAPVIATNVYKFNGNSWYMIAHHASVDAAGNRDVSDDEPPRTRH